MKSMSNDVDEKQQTIDELKESDRINVEFVQFATKNKTTVAELEKLRHRLTEMMARNEELTKRSHAIHLTQIKVERKNTGQLQASLKMHKPNMTTSEAKREELTRAMESVRAELAKEKLKLAELEREYDTQQSEFVEAEKERRRRF